MLDSSKIPKTRLNWEEANKPSPVVKVNYSAFLSDVFELKTTVYKWGAFTANKTLDLIDGVS